MARIKKNPVVILIKASIVNIFIALLAIIFLYLNQQLEQVDIVLNVESSIPILIIGLASQVIIFSYIFLSWYFQTYTITKNALIEEKGIIFKERKVIPIKKLESLEYKQGPIGKLLKYGTLTLKNSINSLGHRIDFVPSPKDVLDTIKDIKETGGRNIQKEIEPPKIKTLIKEGENNQIEFKATFRWDLKKKQVNKEMEKSVIKSVAGLMNSNGGYVLLGISDDKKISGLEKDYKSLPKKNKDGFENHFNQILSKMMGAEYRQFVTIKFEKFKKKELCLLAVTPSYDPVYVKHDGKDEFYVRTGNTTTPMSLREATSYIKNHWK